MLNTLVKRAYDSMGSQWAIYIATHEKSPLKPLMHIMLVYMGTMENPRELNGFNIKLRVQVSKKY